MPEAEVEPNEASTLLDRDEDEGTENKKSWVPAWSDSPGLFVLISMFAVASCLCMIVSQIIPFLVVDVSILEGLLRIYIIVFTIVFCLAEMEISYVVNHLASMQNWIVRGLMYSFLGLIGENEARSVMEYRAVKGHLRTSIDSKMASIFITVSSWAMVVAGIIYFIMGICMMKKLRDGHRQRNAEATFDV